MKARKYTLTKLFISLFLLITLTPMALANGTNTASASSQVNIVVGGLFLLVFMKFVVAGILGYLWYRHSKYRKEKVILDI